MKSNTGLAGVVFGLLLFLFSGCSEDEVLYPSQDVCDSPIAYTYSTDEEVRDAINGKELSVVCLHNKFGDAHFLQDERYKFLNVGYCWHYFGDRYRVVEWSISFGEVVLHYPTAIRYKVGKDTNGNILFYDEDTFFHLSE